MRSDGALSTLPPCRDSSAQGFIEILRLKPHLIYRTLIHIYILSNVEQL